MQDVSIKDEHVDSQLKQRKSVFKNLSYASVSRGAEVRSNGKPELIHQAGTSLCGPACFIYWIAADTPRVYSRYVDDLCLTGVGRIGNLKVEPSTACKNYDPEIEKAKGKGDVPAPADWIALASLRDSENTFRAYDEIDDQAAGITAPREIQSWYKLAGYTQTKNTTINKQRGVDSYSPQQHRDLEEASRLFLGGYRVSLLISKQVLEDEQGGFEKPDHWVNLLSPVKILEDGGERFMSADFYSWGKKFNKKVKLETFLNNFWGLVAAS